MFEAKLIKYSGSQEGSVAELETIPCEAKGHFMGLASDNTNKIYFSGGYLWNGMLSQVPEFDIEERTIKNLPDLKVSRSYHGSTLLDSKLYMYGGSGNG